MILGLFIKAVTFSGVANFSEYAELWSIFMFLWWVEKISAYFFIYSFAECKGEFQEDYAYPYGQCDIQKYSGCICATAAAPPVAAKAEEVASGSIFSA